jgi:integrase
LTFSLYLRVSLLFPKFRIRGTQVVPRTAFGDRMAAFKFTARRLPAIPAKGRVDYWDTILPNFGMRVSSGGTRTWIVMYRYNKVKRRMNLGRHPALGLAAARDLAREATQKADKGGDPASERKVRRSRMDTVEDLKKLYIDEYAKKKKRSWKKDEQILNREVLPLIGRKRVIDVTRQHIRDVLQPIIDRDALIRANHTLEVVRKMFNWAINEKDWPITNPAAGIEPPGEVKNRTRYLKEDELVRFWQALDPKRISENGVGLFKLLMLTAQREMEVLRMRWDEIDWKEFIWTIPEDRAKNELEHAVPLPPLAVWVLSELRNRARAARGLPVMPTDGERASPTYGMTGFVFVSPVKPTKAVIRSFIEKRIIKLRKASQIADVTVHDLRRTAVTYFGKVGVEPWIKKKVINHAKRKKSDATEIYDRFEYIAEKRIALIKWEKLLLATVGEEFDTQGYADSLFDDDGSNVVALHRAKA